MPAELFMLISTRIGRSVPFSILTSSIAAALLAVLAMLLLAAPMAVAENGTGLAGPTTDKTITFFCFGVIAFFSLLVIILSLIQGRLEKRKEMRKQTLQRLG